MKYGKEFQQILDDPHLPEEWKSSAIEYRQLKKLIKDVVAELSSMGLSPGVLHKLMVTEENDGSALPPLDPVEMSKEEDSVLEFEFDSEEGTPPTVSAGKMPDIPLSSNLQAKEATIDPVLEDIPHSQRRHSYSTHQNAEAGPSSLPNQHHRKFRLRLLSENARDRPVPNTAPIRPMGVTEMFKSMTEQVDLDVSGAEHRRTGGVDRRRGRRTVRRAVTDGHGGVKAEYVLIGDAPKPVPQLRLHLHPRSLRQDLAPPVPSSAESGTDDTTDEEEIHRSRPPNGYGNEQTPRPTKRKPQPDVDVIPSSPTFSGVRYAASPIWALASGNVTDGLQNLNLGDSAVEEAPMPQIPPLHPESRSKPVEREFIIPLASDLAFFNLLTAALESLSAFHAAQQFAFRQSVEHLCRLISQSIQPSASFSVLPTPLSPSDSTSAAQKSSKTSHKDLYAWREIFTMWIEAEIFESSAERSRGERTVTQAEERLKKFAEKVVKRGLGDRRTMKGKKVKEAWEEFLRLNVLLLDLKRFQMANINAARKILKKHDKRTALTPSAGFPSFVRSTLSAQVDKDGNVSTWTFYNNSLPHVLLASLTDTLLPILPSLDDYACLICTSIAFKPIRLNCNHLFCVRCLVKMQRAGKAECPLCRSKVVLLADKNSLDLTVMKFMKEWFPKEVKEKKKENEMELAKEQVREAGLDPRCIIM